VADASPGDVWAPVTFSPAAREKLAAMLDVAAGIDRVAERERLHALGVDPGRVIEGETVRKEIEDT